MSVGLVRSPLGVAVCRKWRTVGSIELQLATELFVQIGSTKNRRWLLLLTSILTVSDCMGFGERRLGRDALDGQPGLEMRFLD